MSGSSQKECVSCASVLTPAPPILCGLGRSLIYGASAAECLLFRADAVAFDEVIAKWTMASNLTGSSLYPACRDALEVLFCAQQQVFQPDETHPDTKGAPSTCSSYRRDYRSRCLSFCPPIRDACPVAAYTHCEERCRAATFEQYCTILEVGGLDPARWSSDTLDMMNLYRLEAEQATPLLRDGRPIYRSIPARRPAGSSRATKLDYYVYATNLRGFTEWLLDTNDIDSDGAVAYVSDSNLAPYRINSDWSIWDAEHHEWSTETVRVRCHDGESSSSAVAWRARSAWLGGALALVAAMRTAAW